MSKIWEAMGNSMPVERVMGLISIFKGLISIFNIHSLQELRGRVVKGKDGVRNG